MREGLLYPNNSRENLSCDPSGAIGNPIASACVSGWQERLWESLVAFEAVQLEHSQAFASGRCDNLTAQQAEREKALARLQMALEVAQDQLLVDAEGGFANCVRAKFAAVIAMETTLAEEARKVRQHMLDALGAIRQGRRILQGYGQHHDASPRPRFLNSKT
jgi:hypothetical protein